MKALTVQQGWASLIFIDRSPKDIENRSRPTKYRGDLLIHAGQSKKSVKIAQAFCESIGVPYPTNLTYGAILGVVTLADCIENSDSPWAMPGYWHWVLENPRPIASPIPSKGALSMWSPSIEVIGLINALSGY
jgi:hypothetical protein